MKTKDNIDKLFDQSEFKIRTALVDKTKEIELMSSQFVDTFSIQHDFAYFIENYAYLTVENDKFGLSIGGILSLFEDFDITQFREIFCFSSSSMSTNKLNIIIFFNFKCVNTKGVYYYVYINDIDSSISIESDTVYFVPNFNSFLLKIPEIITKKGIQKLITAANLDFNIDKAGSYGYLKKPLPPVIDDGLPF